MDREGVWALFWATGLPEAWLATRIKAEDGGERDAALCAAPNEESSGL